MIRQMLSILVLIALGCRFVAAQPAPFADVKVIHTLPWNSDAITGVSFIGNDKVAAGNKRGDILIWNLPAPGGKTPDPVRRLVGHTNDINRLLVTPDGKTLISASSDHTVKFWDALSDTGEPGKVVLNDGVVRFGVSEKVKELPKLPPPIEAKVVLQKPIKDLTAHKEWVQGLSQSADGKRLATGDDRGVIIVWEIPSAKEVSRWQTTNWVRSLGLSPDGKIVAASEHVPIAKGVTPTLRFWDAETGKMKADLSKEVKGGMAAVAYSPDGKWLAVCRGNLDMEGPTGIVTLLDPATGKKIRELKPGHIRGATDLAFHPDGKHLFSSGRDRVVKIWRLDDGNLVRELGQAKDLADWIYAISISPDGRLLAAADMVGQVVIYSLTGKQ